MESTVTPPVHTRLTSLSVVQHNCRGSNVVFLTLFSLIWNRNVSFLCLQDPLLFQDEPFRPPGYQCFVSSISGFKKRVAIYVNCFLIEAFSYLYFSPAVDVLHLLVSRSDGGKILERYKFFLCLILTTGKSITTILFHLLTCLPPTQTPRLSLATLMCILYTQTRKGTFRPPNEGRVNTTSG